MASASSLFVWSHTHKLHVPLQDLDTRRAEYYLLVTLTPLHYQSAILQNDIARHLSLLDWLLKHRSSSSNISMPAVSLPQHFWMIGHGSCKMQSSLGFPKQRCFWIFFGAMQYWNPFWDCAVLAVLTAQIAWGVKNHFLAVNRQFSTTADCQKSTTATDCQKSSLICLPRLKNSKISSQQALPKLAAKNGSQ